MDLVEVEVLKAEPISCQQPRHRVRRRHQQAVGAVDVVDRRRLGVGEVGQWGQRVLGGPFFGRQQRHRGAVSQRSRVARRHGGVAGLHPEHRLELGQLLRRRIRPQIVVAVQTEKRGDQVVEETAVVGRRHVAMAGRGQLILVDPFDAQLLGGNGLVLAHRQSGARLAVHRNLDPEAGREFADQLQPVDVGLRPPQPQQGAAQVVSQPDRRVGSGVHAAGGGNLVATRGDTISRGNRRLQAGPTGLLQVESRCVGRQRGPEHTFAHQVEVAAVLEDRAPDDGTQPLTRQTEPVDQPTQRRGEHVLVGRLGVRPVRARERDAIAAQHSYAAQGT